jgi:hypothetical protein
MITVYYDKLALRNVGYPNLAQGTSRPYTEAWHMFDHQYPRVVPLRLLMYTSNYKITTINRIDSRAWYPIGIGWFDFNFDYFENIPCLELIKNNQLRVLFYYHEGDNPYNIKQRLDQLVIKHTLPSNCYTFISANTQAQSLENFIYFPDHEFFFKHVNRHQSAPTDKKEMHYNFTVLNRLPKWWRASILADLLQQGLLNNSLVSFNTGNIDVDDDEDNNPIEVDCIPGWRNNTRDMCHSRLICDHMNSIEQNNHHVVNVDLYSHSRCSIVLETHFDVDQSGGAFLTEKTFKPIKYGQPFVIAGGPGSLQALRDMGYRVFDDVIDNQYDTIHDNTQRYFALRNTIKQILKNQDFYRMCQNDVAHNQQIFEERQSIPVNNLLKELQCRLQ